jgi:hypothetical protein
VINVIGLLLSGREKKEEERSDLFIFYLIVYMVYSTITSVLDFA